MLIREKTERDASACLALLLAVHDLDGYPRYLPEDAQGFVTPEHETDAWVAAQDGAVVGHVALHCAWVDPTLRAAQRATGLPPERLAVVARLLVDPRFRRAGIGRALTATAIAHARRRSQRAVLDVAQDAAAPIALYEATGWTRLDPLRLEFEDGISLDLWVYLSPE